MNGWLDAASFGAIADFGPQHARKVLKNAHEGKDWQGSRLNIIQIECQGAHELRAPSRDEFAALAAALCPNDAAAAAELALHGETQGNFRSMVNAHRQARMLAAGHPVTLNEIQNATFMMGDI